MISSKPSQYIKGYVEFYKLKFKVTPDVLIPRPETELLVDKALSFLKHTADLPTHRSTGTPTHRYTDILILDIGTGSGNIAISIAKNLSLHLEGVKLKIIATDISTKALKVAKQNAKLHGVEAQIEFVESDLLAAVNNDVLIHRLTDTPTHRPTDILIVTNLPYIPSARIPYLGSSVKDFEPKVALDGGEDGFALYRKLFKQILRLHLEGPPAGRAGVKLIIGEIDYTHGELAVNEALKYFPKASVEVKTDLAYKQRILKITFP